MSFQNAVFNSDHAENLSYPTIQYHRGDLSSANAALKDGCYQLPVETFGSIVGDTWNSVHCLHGGGVVIDSYVLSNIHLAVLAYQKRWFVTRNDRVEYLDHYQDGAKSRFRLLGVCRELYEIGYEAPVVLSVSGLNGKHVDDALRKFKSDVITTASRLTKQRIPLYAFWMPLAVAPKMATRNSQYITPPMLNLSSVVNQELLDRLFVGDEVLSLCDQYWTEAKAWSQQRKEAQPEQNGAVEPEVVEAEAEPEIEKVY